MFLQYNKITSVNLDSFEGCVNLKFLALQFNQIEHFPNLSYLKALEFLDLSGNLIKQLNPKHIPERLVVLKLHGNPLIDSNSNNKYEYRKPFVLWLEELDKLDKINVLPVERLSY